VSTERAKNKISLTVTILSEISVQHFRSYLTIEVKLTYQFQVTMYNTASYSKGL
jgi:hypothetical protein